MKKGKMFEVRKETLIISLPEELDHYTAGVIKEQTDELFHGNRIRNVIFDYKNTFFMDSSGIGLVMGRYRAVRFLNGNIYIVGVNDKISRILEISGLYRVAKKSKGVKDALSIIEKE